MLMWRCMEYEGICACVVQAPNWRSLIYTFRNDRVEAGEWRLAALDVRTRIRSREIQLAKHSGTRSVPSREVGPRRILLHALARCHVQESEVEERSRIQQVMSRWFPKSTGCD
jgi:hypothetical protein